MELLGKNLIAGNFSAQGNGPFSALNPADGSRLDPLFHEASDPEINQSLNAATEAFEIYRSQTPEQIAQFLESISEEILGLGEELIRRAQQETALPEARLVSERGRTVNQIKMFAELAREGSWVEASIDRA